MGFGIGTITTMILYTFLVGKISLAIGDKKKDKIKYLQIGSGILAIIVGLYWIFVN
ncbi:MAG: hypothetical protein R2771_11240 [Saprospiraceae bacterium]